MKKTMVTKVEFLEPGTLFAEESTVTVKDRIPANLRRLPKYTYALHYYDMEVILDGKKHFTTGEELHRSPRIVFGKKVHWSKVEDSRRNQILRRNLKNNGDGGYGIKCIAGNWQAFFEDDIVLNSHADLVKFTTPI